MDESTNMDQFQQLITRLDQKVADIEARRTDPQAIASMITSNLQGFIGVMLSNFLSKKKEEEEELKKPRSMLQPVIPIDIIRVSPKAAEQIAAALQAAGIGKYNIKINQINEESKSGGIFGSIFKLFTTVVGWVAKGLASFLMSFKKSLPLLGLVVAGALFSDEIASLLNIAESPETIFGGDEQSISSETNPQTVSQTPGFQQATTSGDTFDDFLATDDGQEYIEELESKSAGTFTRDYIAESSQMFNKQIDDTFDVESIHEYNNQSGDDAVKEFKTKYMEQSMSEQSITPEFLKEHAAYLKGEGSEQERVDRAIKRVEQDATQLETYQSKANDTTAPIIQQIVTDGLDPQAYFRSTQYTDQLIKSTPEPIQLQYQQLKSLLPVQLDMPGTNFDDRNRGVDILDSKSTNPSNSTPPLPTQSSAPFDSLESQFVSPPTPDTTSQAYKVPDSPITTPQSSPATNDESVNRIQQLLNRNNNELQLSNEQLEAILAALQSLPPSTSSESTHESTSPVDDNTLDIEMMRSMAG